jgi:PAS domain S-box-containing protein
MSMETQVVLLTSAGISIAAALLSWRLRQVFRSGWTWIPVAGLLLFALRPLLVLAALWTGAVAQPPSLGAELAGLIASALALFGVVRVMPAIRSLSELRPAPLTPHDDREHQVQARTVEPVAASEPLRESEERMRTMVENLPVMVEALDENDLIVIWNRECERVTGYTAAQMIGNPRAFETLYPDPAKRDEIEREFTRRGGNYQDWELPVTCRDGTQRLIAWSNVSDQHPIPGWRTWAIGVDVTGRRLAEEALLRAQELLERRIAERTAALQSANESLQREIAERTAAERAEREHRALSEALRDTATALNSTLDLDEVLRRVLINVEQVVPHDAANVMLVQEGIARVVMARGYTPHVAQERVLAVSLVMDQTPHLRRVIETGQVQILSDVTADADWITLPETQWIRSYAVAPIRLEGEVIGFLNLDSATPGAFTAEHGERLQAFADQAAVAVRNARLYDQARRELTERQRAEVALRLSEERLRTTLDALDDIVYVVDSDLQLVLVNEAFRRWNQELGLATDPIGHTPFELFPFLPEQARDDYRHVFETGEAVTTEESLQVGTMELFTETRKVPVLMEDTGLWVLTVMRDVTERRRADQQAIQLTLEQERGAILTSFIRDVSHEFANPLTVIKNDLYLIMRTEDPVEWQPRLENISAQVFHIERLVEGLMTMSRLDAGVDLPFEPLDVNRLLQTVLDGQTSTLQRQRHAVITDLNPDLPLIQANQRYLYQALTKLVENAIQYTPPDGSIRLRTYQSGEFVIIEVSDTGVGIRADDLTHIFDRFFRVDTAHVQRGAGLGLPIARRVIELHGGRLEVESTPGVGSTFRVFLPISPG